MKMKKPDAAFTILFIGGCVHDLRIKLKDWRDKMEPDLVKLIDTEITYTDIDTPHAINQSYKVYQVFGKLFKSYDSNFK